MFKNFELSYKTIFVRQLFSKTMIVSSSNEDALDYNTKFSFIPISCQSQFCATQGNSFDLLMVENMQTINKIDKPVTINNDESSLTSW